MKYYRFKNKRTLRIIKFIDTVGYILSGVFPPAKINTTEIKKILLIRLDHIGDCILTTPAIRYLRKKFPDAHISMLVNTVSAEIIKSDPSINEFIMYDAFWFNRNKTVPILTKVREMFVLIKKLRKKRFDLAIDFRGDIRNIFLAFLSGIKFKIGFGIGGAGFLLSKETEYSRDVHEVEKNVNIIKDLFPGEISGMNLQPVLYIPEESVNSAASKFLGMNGINNDDFLVGIHPGAGFQAKLWEEKKWAEVADKLIEQYNAKIIITGSKAERKMMERISESMKGKSVIASNLNLTELSDIIRRYKLLVSVDSVAIHIASALKVPVVVIMSATNRKKEWCPVGTKSIVIQKDVNCKLCELEECKNHICMSSVSPAEVIRSTQQLL